MSGECLHRGQCQLDVIVPVEIGMDELDPAIGRDDIGGAIADRERGAVGLQAACAAQGDTRRLPVPAESLPVTATVCPGAPATCTCVISVASR